MDGSPSLAAKPARCHRDTSPQAEIDARTAVEALSVLGVLSGLPSRHFSGELPPDGLVIMLGTRAFNLLSEGLDSLPTTEDPARDLIEAGVVVFRRFTLSHPALFTIGFLKTGISPEIAREFRCAQENALARLHARIGRLKNMGQFGTRSESQAALEFHALCEGLAMMERRCILHPDEAEQIWRDALRALVVGWTATG